MFNAWLRVTANLLTVCNTMKWKNNCWKLRQAGFTFLDPYHSCYYAWRTHKQCVWADWHPLRSCMLCVLKYIVWNTNYCHLSTLSAHKWTQRLASALFFCPTHIQASNTIVFIWCGYHEISVYWFTKTHAEVKGASVCGGPCQPLYVKTLVSYKLVRAHVYKQRKRKKKGGSDSLLLVLTIIVFCWLRTRVMWDCVGHITGFAAGVVVII